MHGTPSLLQVSTVLLRSEISGVPSDVGLLTLLVAVRTWSSCSWSVSDVIAWTTELAGGCIDSGGSLPGAGERGCGVSFSVAGTWLYSQKWNAMNPVDDSQLIA